MDSGLLSYRYTAPCHECGKQSGVTFAKSASMNHLPKEFEKRGWRISKKATGHTCPKCVKKDLDMSNAPREMELKDRRKIIAKIVDVYDDANSRYVDDITDFSVASELNVPRAWVERIREENFGPSGKNEEMERVSTAVGQLAADYKKLADEFIACASKCEAKEKEVERVLTRVRNVERSVGPRRA